MARATKVNHIKLKVWGLNSISEIEAPSIADGLALAFWSIPTPEEREKALADMHAAHAKLSEAGR